MELTNQLTEQKAVGVIGADAVKPNRFLRFGHDEATGSNRSRAARLGAGSIATQHHPARTAIGDASIARVTTSRGKTASWPRVSGSTSAPFGTFQR
jgi:hypothetical protein